MANALYIKSLYVAVITEGGCLSKDVCSRGYPGRESINLTLKGYKYLNIILLSVQKKEYLCINYEENERICLVLSHDVACRYIIGAACKK